jgi:hypothetical protein
MKRKEMIEKDINEFLNNQQGLDISSKRELLKNMFNKHIILTESPLEIDYYDTVNVLGQAANIYSEMSMPVRISGKTLDSNQVIKLAVLESFISFLNNKGAIKRLPIFKKEG